MAVYGPGQASCLVFTYKEGLLSRVGHDLKIRFERFSIRFEDGTIQGEFSTDSGRTVCAMKKGQEDHRALSEKDRKTIDDATRTDVLKAKKHPKIQVVMGDFRGEAGEYTGQVTLNGVERRVPISVTREADEWVAKARIDQPQFGIKPFTALLGTLKIKPEVDVEVRIPAH